MELLERSGVPEMLESWMPTTGRPRVLSPKEILFGMLVAIDEDHVAHLTAGHEALSDSDPGEKRSATYRQFTNTHQVMIRAIDPSPCPSYKGVADNERQVHLLDHRLGVDPLQAVLRLETVMDALIDASVPEVYKDASRSLAIDWTDHETWSRPRAKDDPQPANDPDASWGHAKRNAPGAIDHLFFGYYAQAATMVKDERGKDIPELVRAVVFLAPRHDPAAAIPSALLRRSGNGLSFKDVLADCGYSNRHPDNFARPIRRAGGDLTVDLHPEDRGPKATYKGAIVSNGNLFCPCTPSPLLKLGPLNRGAGAAQAELHDAQSAELSHYKLGRVARGSEDGAQRGDVSCPLGQGPLSFT
jgi:hypothetical protein